ncbi:hypothetical protein GCM10028862_19130 [Luteimonas pelagia]
MRFNNPPGDARDRDGLGRTLQTNDGDGRRPQPGNDMNAIHAPHLAAPRVPTHGAAPHAPRRRRWAIGLSVAGAFLGLYVLGLVWFAHALQDDMQATLQLAPAVQDTAHRAE